MINIMQSRSVNRLYLLLRNSLFNIRYSIFLILAACSTQREISKAVQSSVLQDSALQHAHVGISLYDVSDNTFIYNYQGNKYFVPASNTKLITCYAALKYLGDSLPGISYLENDTAIFLVPTGDPTLLHIDYGKHPVIDFLKRTNKPLYITDTNWKDEPLGMGWSWNDYNEGYMAERSPMPVYGNTIRWVQEMNENALNTTGMPQTPSIYSMPEINWKVRFNTGVARRGFFVQRNRDDNFYLITEGTEKKKEQDVPFVTKGIASALELLKDTVGRPIVNLSEAETSDPRLTTNSRLTTHDSRLKTIRSQATDSLLRPMMHRSDNFFAEQSLLMVSQAKLGIMSDSRIVDTLLKTDLRDLPQRPRWADGSGLSRYNLFTPNDFVVILRKMRDEFGMDRMKVILPTGNEGTLTNLYKQDSNHIFAKTGTLSGVVAISGYLYTRKNKLLIFSILVNNHTGSAITIRRRIEEFLTGIRNRY